MSDLAGLRVAMIATDGVEQPELTEPKRALEEAGATVDVIAPKSGSIQAFHHHDKGDMIEVDRTLDEARPEDYGAVVLPGGALNADAIRRVPALQQFLVQMDRSGKPLAAICHAPWELISANIARGRTLTSYFTIQDDIRNAGANWVDEEVVVDGNLVTSRKPDDIPAFNREMVKLFSGAAVPA